MAGLEGKSVEEIQALAELANGLANDPKTRNGFLHLTKMANPSAAIPEIDIPANITRALEAPLKKLDALAEAQARRETQDSIEAQRRSLAKKGVNEADIDRLEKLMVEKKIPDHETALEFMQMQDKAAIPSSSSTLPSQRKLDSFTAPDLKEYGGDLQKFGRATAYKVIDELRGRKAAA
jgi:hypothetical protein